ncbi:MAG: hypothetical protein RIC55_31950, partial [Pirellulaceae bacterium]
MGMVLMMFGLVLCLGSFVCGIIILIAAFQEDAVQGLLSRAIARQWASWHNRANRIRWLCRRRGASESSLQGGVPCLLGSLRPSR